MPKNFVQSLGLKNMSNYECRILKTKFKFVGAWVDFKKNKLFSLKYSEKATKIFNVILTLHKEVRLFVLDTSKK